MMRESHICRRHTIFRLNYLVDHDFENLTEEQLGEMLTFANAAAALVTTKKGAIKAMPVKEEVLELIQK